MYLANPYAHQHSMQSLYHILWQNNHISVLQLYHTNLQKSIVILKKIKNQHNSHIPNCIIVQQCQTQKFITNKFSCYIPMKPEIAAALSARGELRKKRKENKEIMLQYQIAIVFKNVTNQSRTALISGRRGEAPSGGKQR